jgi:hypothetical protein
MEKQFNTSLFKVNQDGNLNYIGTVQAQEAMKMAEENEGVYLISETFHVFPAQEETEPENPNN